MEVIIVALVGFVVIGVVWELCRQHDSYDSVSRHENLMRELHRYD
jgi:hypothetical protein